MDRQRFSEALTTATSIVANTNYEPGKVFKEWTTDSGELQVGAIISDTLGAIVVADTDPTKGVAFCTIEYDIANPKAPGISAGDLGRLNAPGDKLALRGSENDNKSEATDSTTLGLGGILLRRHLGVGEHFIPLYEQDGEFYLGNLVLTERPATPQA